MSIHIYLNFGFFAIDLHPGEFHDAVHASLKKSSLSRYPVAICRVACPFFPFRHDVNDPLQIRFRTLVV